MKKTFLLAILVLGIVLVISACAQSDNSGVKEPVVSTPVSESPAPITVSVTGRIIETVDGDYTIIRNEEDTSIYYKIDISNGITAGSGVSTDLEPNNVIAAKVEMLDAEALPKATVLIELTENISPDYNVIDAEEAKAMIDAGNVIILDVRTREEYEAGYIENSFNLPLGTIESGIGKITSDKDAVLLVYCRSGNRSKVAARELTELGYTNVYDFGGIVDWPYGIIEK